ncbi:MULTISPECIES: hypothetical protein [unclassified Campylobacter]|uniref:hypothetical protein n=1 Tax=unclassified Campylobacter TaxID=2593542 RepID=UPI0022E9D1DF|nr:MULTISPECIES: hypothetical protein [unclassified Campylobacter]MDA3042527.1 hypothetical protein [Campylobacter sp. JMF_09 ED2]MDA3044659.1 hypothetical protein [Campylobacter sp. JMF_07 ED4]MDA3063219.1 hypothetical protein [Campylobacter sp. JMF_11 EL3]MDA3071636.1 hypothetical protein [Campylobacter sp. VBCF_03 NA9]MDA3074300.1 hypothetical protein [Campylobacter sp. JMF_05 ED3]
MIKDYALLGILGLLALVLVYRIVFRKALRRRAYKGDIFPKKEPVEIKPVKKKIIPINQVDILKPLKFQSEILFEECSRYDSSVFIKFPPDAPRYYDGYVINLSNAIYHICLFFLQNVKDPTLIKIVFSVRDDKPGLSRMQLLVDISVKKEIRTTYIHNLKTALISGKVINDPYISKAKQSIGDVGKIAELSNDNGGTHIKLHAQCSYLEQENRLRAKKYNYQILIAHKDKEIFDDLKDFLDSTGCNVVPNNTWENLKTHLADRIYKADIVLIDSEILRTDSTAIAYLNLIDKEEAHFVFLRKNANSQKALNDLKFNFFKLDMPYFHDEIYAILDLVKQLKIDKDFLKVE